LYDQLFDGRRIRVLAVLDTWSRVCPVLWVRRTATAWEVTSALDRAVGRFGAPKVIRVDQGRQFTSRELDLWAYGHGVTLDFSRPGKPTDNAYIESFNARVRADRERRSRSGPELVSGPGRCPPAGGGLARGVQRGETA
jgi:putative transposase